MSSLAEEQRLAAIELEKKARREAEERQRVEFEAAERERQEALLRKSLYNQWLQDQDLLESEYKELTTLLDAKRDTFLKSVSKSSIVAPSSSSALAESESTQQLDVDASDLRAVNTFRAISTVETSELFDPENIAPQLSKAGEAALSKRLLSNIQKAAQLLDVSADKLAEEKANNFGPASGSPKRIGDLEEIFRNMKEFFQTQCDLYAFAHYRVAKFQTATKTGNFEYRPTASRANTIALAGGVAKAKPGRSDTAKKTTYCDFSFWGNISKSAKIKSHDFGLITIELPMSIQHGDVALTVSHNSLDLISSNCASYTDECEPLYKAGLSAFEQEPFIDLSTDETMNEFHRKEEAARRQAELEEAAKRSKSKSRKGKKGKMKKPEKAAAPIAAPPFKDKPREILESKQKAAQAKTKLLKAAATLGQISKISKKSDDTPSKLSTTSTPSEQASNALATPLGTPASGMSAGKRESLSPALPGFGRHGRRVSCVGVSPPRGSSAVSLMKLVKPPKRNLKVKKGEADVVHLDIFYLIGGVLDISCVHLPAQPVTTGHWTAFPVVNKAQLDTFQFPPESSKTEYFVVSFKCDKSKYLLTEEPTLAMWDRKLNVWREGYITNCEYEKDKAAFKFRLLRLGPLGLFVRSDLHFPYQYWFVKPLSESRVRFVLRTALVKLYFELSENLICLRAPEGYEWPVIGDLSDNWVTLPAMMKMLKQIGVYIFPSSADLEPKMDVAGIAEKILDAEAVVYKNMAWASSSMAFQHSRWNSSISSDVILFRMCPVADLQVENENSEGDEADWPVYMYAMQSFRRLQITDSSEKFSATVASSSRSHISIVQLANEARALAENSQSSPELTLNCGSELFLTSYYKFLCILRVFNYSV